MLLPVFALLAANGIQGIHPDMLWRACAVALPGLSLIPMQYLSAKDRDVRFRIEGDESDMIDAVIARWHPSDVILCTSLTRAPLEYYPGRAGIDARIPSFPRLTERNLGAQNDRRLLLDPEALREEARVVIGEARRLSAPDGRLFLLRAKTEVNTPLLPVYLRRQHHVYPKRILGNFLQTGTGEIIAASMNRMHASVGPTGSEAAHRRRKTR